MSPELIARHSAVVVSVSAHSCATARDTFSPNRFPLRCRWVYSCPVVFESCCCALYVVLCCAARGAADTPRAALVAPRCSTCDLATMLRVSQLNVASSGVKIDRAPPPMILGEATGGVCPHPSGGAEQAAWRWRTDSSCPSACAAPKNATAASTTSNPAFFPIILGLATATPQTHGECHHHARSLPWFWSEWGPTKPGGSLRSPFFTNNLRS